MSFGSYEDAESFLLRDKTIVKAKQNTQTDDSLMMA